MAPPLHYSSCFATPPLVSLMFMLRYSSYFATIRVSLLLLVLRCCSSYFAAGPRASLLLFHYCSYFASLLFLVLCCCSYCFASLFLLLHYSCYFVPPSSCITTAWCFIAPLPSKVLFCPLLLCYSFVLHASLLPCPNWYFPPFLFSCSVLDI